MSKIKCVCDAVADVGAEDDSLVSCSEATIAEGGFVAGDTVLIKGKKGKDSLAILIADDACEAEKVRMSATCRRNLGLALGDVCFISAPSAEVQFATTVKVLPYDDSVKGITGNIYDVFVKPYFMDAYRPVKRGDRFMSRRAMKSVEFKIVEVEPGPYAIVGPDTLVDCKGDPIKRRDESKLSDVGYDDVGGVSKQLGTIREMVEMPLRHTNLFTNLGVPMPRGVLIYGPAGCGKTLLARAVANETGAYMVLINGPEIMGLDKKEEAVVAKFEEAQDNAPAIILIDEIDSLAPRREGNTSEGVKRMVSCLLLQIDALSKTTLPVIVIGATSVPSAIDGALRRFGRFDREIDLGVPDDEGRLEILKVHTRHMKLSGDVDLLHIAKSTHGYVGADISQLTMEAALQCIRDSMGALDLEADELDSAVLDSMCVTNEHLAHALKETNPSSMREMVVQVPETSWASIGGLEDVKMELQELVQYPVEHPEKFEAFGMQPSRGVLFYGPPGCGKTLMAKAVANECQANFISVKGPELLNAYFGESEANVRMVFDRARSAAPCVLFFDELDSIAVARGSGNSSNGAMDRVINQLLTEIDGVGSKKNVFVVGATNRPDIIDAALMRPGRLDQLMYIPMPDYGSRLAILKATFRKAKLSPDISLEYLAECLEGYTGADLSEICQHAAKVAIKQNIEEEIKKIKGLFKGEPVEIIDVHHLEYSVRTSRKSVSEEDLAEYASFAYKMKRMAEEVTETGSSMSKFSFANNPNKK